ncbi:phosphatidylserine/phosphatidylglycerophosphate/cardiolipin synthase family protein [Hephaestia sp. GCM10023244]|uniref:phospholipase D-like domain-containing protein n=1 Tax=unclassified Hephaestia TaxID=2631281 RepID=UPI002076E047|nr:phosphatidylserine/phosphatidylglycerophosphate/cardiolipin synthase family protein [Hephaestia sp. MAHUQ-44]MCM8731299.1 phosphatidylserine/phosphatidylglycerophosphate/cardiolipin synthase family protein [Hephaestia sp. MAHUQ-44]
MERPPPQPTFTIAGNRLRLLDTGPGRLDALVDLIEGARQSLRIIYYIYSDDASGRRVRDAMLAAARRGVAVSLIVDAFGSDAAENEHFFAPLEAAGASVCEFEPRFGRRYLLRNHQKLALADAEGEARIIIGGFNIEDDYFGTRAEDAWRDLGLIVEGPAAARLAGYFDVLSNWVRQPHGGFGDLRRTLNRFSDETGALRWLMGGPTRLLSAWARTVQQDMRAAMRIDIIAAYFCPTPGMLRRFDKAGIRRGSRVRIVTAGKSDNKATIAAARFTYAGLLRKGVEVYEYQPSKLHTKLYVIDDDVHIGSANFDVRSLFLNLEVMLRIEDPAFAAHARAYVDGEIADSEQIIKAAWKRRTGLWQRIKRATAYFVVAVLDYNLTRRLNFGADEK